MDPSASERGERPPMRLVGSVALVAASMLFIELLLTRIFSVLFGYHFSFFAISLIMSGISLGGLLAARWDFDRMGLGELESRLGILAIAFSAGTLVILVYLFGSARLAPFWMPDISAELPEPRIGIVLPIALVSLPGLIAAGSFLATAFAGGKKWIGRLYAADLIAASAACLAVIPLMRSLQGPSALFLPALLSALAALLLLGRSGWWRPLAWVLVATTGLGTSIGLLSEGNFLDRQLVKDERVILERWNDHSRIVAVRSTPDRYYLTIDRGAGTFMYRIPDREVGAPVPAMPWWDASVIYAAHRLGRPLERTAVIGVGGGADLLAPLKNGARNVDGYELNRIFIDLLTDDFKEFNPIASWPEVNLIHSEARVGIAHSGLRYDLIQASLIDTWAATASGGFVLSENGLYTVEGWLTFLNALEPEGLLTMTRWYLESAPAESQRLISLAAAALHRFGIEDPRDHILLLTQQQLATIVVSRSPFSAREIERADAMAQAEGFELLVVPGREPLDPQIRLLLDPRTRSRAIAQSEFDISAPTDQRPYFFLQIRPWDLAGLFLEHDDLVSGITFNALQILVLLSGLSLVFALIVFLLSVLTLPSARSTPTGRRTYRWLNLYFLGIGFGYILIQLGLHQSVILILGHPTFALSIVLCSMLLGTGLGSSFSKRFFGSERYLWAWISIILVLGTLVLAAPFLSALEALESTVTRAAAVGTLMTMVGFVLGFAFPIGVRIAIPTGEWAVQKLWAVNGAASIAGAVLAAMLGIGLGSRAVLGAGFFVYLFVTLAGLRAHREERFASIGAE